MTITLGNFTQVGGRNVALGGATGLDTESIINSLVGVREIPKTELEEQIVTADSEIDALATFRSKITTLQGSIDIFRNPPGVNNEVNNIFEYRTAFLTSNTSVSASSYLGITVEPGAGLTKFDVEIQQVAALQQSRSSVGVASKDTSLFASDTTFDIDDNLGGVLSTINVQAGDTLENISDKINASQTSTGVTSYILQVSDSDFRLVLESDQTGLSNAFNLDFTADATVNTALGTITTSQPAANAIFSVGGLTINRESNTVSDVLDKVTLNLFEPTPDFGGASPTTVTVEVNQDQELIVAALNQFATDYNDYRTFYAEQSERDEEGLYLETAILAQNSTLNSLSRQLDIEVTKTVAGLTGDLTELNDLGISLVDQEAGVDQVAVSGILSVNENVLRDALNNDPLAFQKVLEFQLVEETGNIISFDRNNSLGVSAFTIDIDRTRAEEDAALITYVDPVSGETEEYFARYSASQDVEFSDDITVNNMFGAATVTDVFNSGISDGDRIRFAIDDPITGITNYDFTFQTTISDINTEFNSLETLATAISNQTNLVTNVNDNTISISAEDGMDSVAITNLDATDIKGTIGLEDLTVVGGRITFDAKDRAISNDITTTSMFGSSDTTTDFSSGISEGDTVAFEITNRVEDLEGNVTVTVTNYSFAFDTTAPVAANGEFSNLSNLATAINSQNGLNAAIYNNKLVVSADNDSDTVAITSGPNTDIKTVLGLDDIVSSDNNITPLRGLELVYIGDAADTGADALSVSMTQGVADRFYNTIDLFVLDQGIIDLDVASIVSRKDSLNDDIERLETQIESYRTQLLDEYSRLEQAVTSANSILQLLEAQNDARNS